MKKYISILVICISVAGFSQEKLSKTEAIVIAMKNNYDIKMSNNNVEVAKNNTSILNNNYLPTLQGTSGGSFTSNSNETVLNNGTVNKVNGATSNRLNAGLNLNYTVFDGFNRKNTFKRLKQVYNISELQARRVVENTLLTLFKSYYEVARLTENETSQKKVLSISKDRLKRAEYGFEFGQNTKLDILNAEVDSYNDSIAYLDVKRQLSNAKRDLNVVLGADINKEYLVDTTMSYSLSFTIDEIVARSKESNASYLEAKKNIELSKYNVAISKSGWMPNVSLTSSYTWSDFVNNDISSFLREQNQTSFNAGINLTWNVFDGGRTKINVQNAKIGVENQEILLKQTSDLMKRNILNAWETYQTALFTLQVRQKNVETNRINFNRTQESYKLGQVTSIDFRQAQNNLLQAELNLSQAKYNAKNSELQLLLFSGDLIEHNNF